MAQPLPRVSLTVTIDEFLASIGVDASARVIRGSSSVYVMVTLNQIHTPLFLTQRHRSISDQLIAYVKTKIDPSWVLEGVYWGFRGKPVGSTALQVQSAMLTEKIRGLRLSRTDVGQDSDF
jgi:hypothetical protein